MQVRERLWTPSEKRIEASNLFHFMQYLRTTHQLTFETYEELYQWSITDLDNFWRATADYCAVRWRRKPMATRRALGSGMLDTSWFPDGTLNYAENLLAPTRNDVTALIGYREGVGTTRTSGLVLWNQVAACAQGLRRLGVQKGDRVAGIVSNSCEAIVAMLATAALGAVWSSCSPDFGIEGIIDRFGQIEPKVVFYTPDYQYAGKRFISEKIVLEAAKRIPSIITMIALTAPHQTHANVLAWDLFLASGGFQADETGRADLVFEPMAFDDPLFIMFSSGTTGVPKCIVHGVGGTLLQHKKELMLHSDLTSEDCLFFFTTCGWMMWNWMVSALSIGCCVAVYDGSVSYPEKDALWRFIEDAKVTVLGTSPKYIAFAMKEEINPHQDRTLALRTILSTGSPLLPEQFAWIYKHFPDVHLASISGGTDIISCFMLGVPTKPVFAGQIQGPGLGMAIQAWDEQEQSVLSQKGELVCVNPFVSMPIGFWDDPDGTKFKNAYFNHYDDRVVWRHGDFIEIDAETGGIIVYGRSDATLNPGGIRIGTAEIYRRVEAFDAVEDSVVVGRAIENDEEIVLLLKLKPGKICDESFCNAMRQKIRSELTPRHVPAKIIQVKDIPYTRSGKKVELAVKCALEGELVKNVGALANPESLDEYREIGKRYREK